MPNRLETMKMREAPEQRAELEKEEEAWPRLPGGAEVRFGLQHITSLRKLIAPLASKVKSQNSGDGGSGWRLWV